MSLGIPGVDRLEPGRGAHLWRANVVRAEGRSVWVEVPALFGDNPAGPHNVLDMGDAELVAGDRVLVAAVNGDQDDLVVVGRIR